MSRHYHDAECTPAALESIEEELQKLTKTLRLLLDLYAKSTGLSHLLEEWEARVEE